jgi:hypothetical protein
VLLAPGLYTVHLEPQSDQMKLTPTVVNVPHSGHRRATFSIDLGTDYLAPKGACSVARAVGFRSESSSWNLDCPLYEGCSVRHAGPLRLLSAVPNKPGAGESND